MCHIIHIKILKENVVVVFLLAQCKWLFLWQVQHDNDDVAATDEHHDDGNDDVYDTLIIKCILFMFFVFLGACMSFLLFVFFIF